MIYKSVLRRSVKDLILTENYSAVGWRAKGQTNQLPSLPGVIPIYQGCRTSR